VNDQPSGRIDHDCSPAVYYCELVTSFNETWACVGIPAKLNASSGMPNGIHAEGHWLAASGAIKILRD